MAAPPHAAGVDVLEAMLDNTRELLAYLDPEFRFVRVNRAYAEAGRRAPEEFVGLNHFELYPHPENQAIFERVRDTGVPAYWAEKPFEYPDQPERGITYWDWTLSPIRGPGGRVAGLVFSLREVTDAVRARNELARRADTAQARLATIVESSEDAICGVGLDGLVWSWNRGAERMYGWTEREIVGRRISILAPPDRQAETAELNARLRRGERVVGLETVRVAKDGRRLDVSLTLSPIRDGSGAMIGVSAIARDVGERKRAEAERRRIEDSLRQAQKLEGIGRLAGGIAHDFNNLLTAIIGADEALLQALPAATPEREDAADIQQAAQRAATLTRQLLAFSRKQVLQPRVLDLNEVVLSIERMLRRVIGEHIALVARPAPGLWPVRADPSHLEQVIVNIAVNARDAVSAGGTITVETANVALDRETAAGAGVAPGDYVGLAIRDDGHGMTPEVRAHLFEPFFTTKERGKGTGLGLSTVYGIVKQAGGAVRVESEVGKGSTFEILLPRADGSAEPARPREDQAPPRGTETVLLAEDEPSVRRLAARTLEKLGYTVWVASDGVEALELADGRLADVDLVITDVIMPRMGGRDLALRLRRERQDLGILFMSGYAEDDGGVQQLVCDGCCLVHKPFSPDALAARVRELLDGRARVEDGRARLDLPRQGR